MDINKENEAVKIIEEMDLRFTSGNAIPVEQAIIKAPQYQALRAIVMKAVTERQQARAWYDMADRQM